jgi:tRNA nucleotidyltransferase (CCA-adding enzyme)
MAAICDRERMDTYRRHLLLLAAVCHDMGKAVSTKFNEEKQKWTAIGHDVAGVPITARFLIDEVGLREGCLEWQKILQLCRWHMYHVHKVVRQKAIASLVKRLEPVSYINLLLLMEADASGRPPLPPGCPPHFRQLIDHGEALGLISPEDTAGIVFTAA